MLVAFLAFVLLGAFIDAGSRSSENELLTRALMQSEALGALKNSTEQNFRTTLRGWDDWCYRAWIGSTGGGRKYIDLS